MGTRATTIYQNKDNGIGLYTRWDGFPSEIKKNILNSESIWEKSFKQISEKINNLPENHPSKSLTSWIESYKRFKQLPKTLEKQSCLLSGLSFSHHYVCNDNSDGWDIVVYQENDSLNFRQRKALDSDNSKLLAIDIPQGYSLIKVSENYNDNEECSYFKIKNFSREEFLQMMTNLPIFWTKFLMLDFQKTVKSKDTFIDSWNRTLGSFMGNRYGKEAVLDSTDAYFNDTIGNASSLIPFDFYNRKLYLHLFMQNPDKIQPLTFGEEKFLKTLSIEKLEEKIVATVENFSMIRLNAFGVSFNTKEPLTSFEAQKIFDFYYNEQTNIAQYLQLEPILNTLTYTDKCDAKIVKLPNLYHFNKSANKMCIHYEISLLKNLYLIEKNKELNSNNILSKNTKNKL